jgi:pyruvate formate lyase activating enzyme
MGQRARRGLTTGPWRCQYCHNPDTWTMSNGFPVSVDHAAEELGKYRDGLKVMKGGVTLSGGEPLMQHRFVAKLLAAAKRMGIHTTIETNGYLGEHLSDAELDTIDLVMLGLKTWNPERHKVLTAGHRSHARVRAPPGGPQTPRSGSGSSLVPGLTDDLEDMAGSAAFAASLGNVQRVEVLPFHQMGRFKWRGRITTSCGCRAADAGTGGAGVRRVASGRARSELVRMGMEHRFEEVEHVRTDHELERAEIPKHRAVAGGCAC